MRLSDYLKAAHSRAVGPLLRLRRPSFTQAEMPSVLWVALFAAEVLFLIWIAPNIWRIYISNRDSITPFLTPLAALLAGWIALGQLKVARLRHEEQTKADRTRRITETFSKATEQLASDKMEARLGGIYTLERLSNESPDDYWVVMETLTAFVRERARWKAPDISATETMARYYDKESQTSENPEPPTDIAAVLSVLNRRSELNREQEAERGWRLDLRKADLREADLTGAYLERANLFSAHLEGANLLVAYLKRAHLEEAYLERASLTGAHLEGANLFSAHLERASLFSAHLEGAILSGAYLKGANLEEAYLEGAHLTDAHLEGARLNSAHLEGASLYYAHLEGASLSGAYLEQADLCGADLRSTNVTQEQLDDAFGDDATKLPPGLAIPRRPQPASGQA